MWKVYFNLTKPSRLEASSEINGMKIGINQGSDQLVVESIEACDETDAQQKAFTAANLFLDTLCWKYGTTFAIDSNSQHIEYVSPVGQKHAYVTVTARSLARIISHVTVVKKDSSGQDIEIYDASKPGLINIKPSEAASHYRHAHLTDDSFNKFRDLYLVAENVASKTQVAKGLDKNEVKQLSESGQSYEEGLLRLALEECFSTNQQSLKQTAKSLPEFDQSQEAIPQVAKILFRGYRCQLNHSKALEDKKIPFDLQDKKEIKAALPLMEIVARSLLQYEENSL